MVESTKLSERDLIDLADKSNAFAREIVGEWKDTFDLDARGFQLRYLYSNAYRAAVSSQSFWLLHSHGHFHDAQIISRTLLERIVSNRVAAQSPERACSLLATNRWKDWEGVRKMVNFNPDAFDRPEIQAHLDICQTDINKFLKMSERTQVFQWNFSDMCKEVGLEWVYRLLYRELSEYTHASYGVSSSNRGDEDSNFAKYLALLAPMDTATQYDIAYHERQREELLYSYKALYHSFADLISGKQY